jgi:hypothetical protein
VIGDGDLNDHLAFTLRESPLLFENTDSTTHWAVLPQAHSDMTECVGPGSDSREE